MLKELYCMTNQLTNLDVGNCFSLTTLSCDNNQLASIDISKCELPEEFKNIEILVNNAGLAKDMTPLYENKISDWEQMIDTNVKGLLYVTKAVLPGMVERDKGHIVNIGSTAGRGTYPGGTVYCATKHAVNAITNGLRKDLLKTSLRVTTIDPGAV